MIYEGSDLFLFILSFFTKIIKSNDIYRFCLILLLFQRRLRKRSNKQYQLGHKIPMNK